MFVTKDYLEELTVPSEFVDWWIKHDLDVVKIPFTQRILMKRALQKLGTGDVAIEDVSDHMINMSYEDSGVSCICENNEFSLMIEGSLMVKLNI